MTGFECNLEIRGFSIVTAQNTLKPQKGVEVQSSSRHRRTQTFGVEFLNPT